MNPTAILAEDEHLLRDQLRELLAAAWPELEIVGIAEDGRQAIRAMEETNPDVLFLDAPPGDVRVCKSAGPAPGFTQVVITVDGRPGSTGDGSQSMNFAVSDRYFVMTSDVRVRDALRDALALSEPRC